MAKWPASSKLAVFLLVLWVLMSVPIVGTALALVIVMMSFVIVVPILKLVQPGVDWLISEGVPKAWAASAPFLVLIAPLTAIFLRRFRNEDLPIETRRRALHALVWLIGMSLTVAYAYWILPRKFG
jgi:hypothetical protein